MIVIDRTLRHHRRLPLTSRHHTRSHLSHAITTTKEMTRRMMTTNNRQKSSSKRYCFIILLLLFAAFCYSVVFLHLTTTTDIDSLNDINRDDFQNNWNQKNNADSSNMKYVLTMCVPSYPRYDAKRANEINLSRRQSNTIGATLASIYEELLTQNELGIPLRVLVVDTSSWSSASSASSSSTSSEEQDERYFSSQTDDNNNRQDHNQYHYHYHAARKKYAHISWMQFAPQTTFFPLHNNHTMTTKSLPTATATATPSLAVQQQSIHMANAITQCTMNSRHVLLWEDDFLLCPRAANHILNALSIATSPSCRDQSVQTWSVLKFSIGMNGLLWKSSIALDFSQYLMDHYLKVPCDLLVFDEYIDYRKYRRKQLQLKLFVQLNKRLQPKERTSKTQTIASWIGSSRHQRSALKGGGPSEFKGNQHILYRYHLGHHLGTQVSTFPERNEESFRHKNQRARTNANGKETCFTDSKLVTYCSLELRKMCYLIWQFFYCMFRMAHFCAMSLCAFFCSFCVLFVFFLCLVNIQVRIG